MIVEKEYKMLICISGEPETRTCQQKGCRVVGGHVHHYEKPEVAKAKARIKDQLVRFVPDKPFTCPIGLSLAWHFGQKVKKKRNTPKVTRPDLDNMAKGFIDCMTDLGFWNDDNLIADLHLSKEWVEPEKAGVIIGIYEVKAEG